MVNMKKHAYYCVYVNKEHIQYRLYINVLAWTHVGIYVISNTVMYCFQNSFIILNVSYLITPMMGHVVYEITYN